MALARAESLLRGRLIGPYQRDGVSWMLNRETSEERPRGGFLCDEMGLGKTVEVIATMLGNKHARTLIVAPKSVIRQWRSEIERFSDLSVHVWDGMGRTQSSEVLRRYEVVITSYGLLVPRNAGTTPLHNISWDRIVLDEGHEIRNPKSKTWKSVRQLAARIRWIVTGTPVFNSVKDFIALCGILGLEKSVVQGFTHQIREKLVLRRTKEDVCQFNPRLALPNCDFQNLELDMNPEEKQIYREAYEGGQETIKRIMKSDNPGRHAMIFLECLLRARQAMIWPQLYLDGIAMKDEVDPEVFSGRSKKMDTLLELISSHPDEKALVFCQFKGEMDTIQQMLIDKEIECFRIDGQVEQEDRQARISAFQTSTKGSVFIIQIKAGGVGLNLQEATRVYITAPSWNPATELQAIARAHRTGQTKKVVIRKLMYSGEDGLPSIEESMMELQGHKSAICAEVLNDPRLVNQIPSAKKSRITIQDIRKLFSG
ncbi:DEAD/DEAH box helicase [bacterium]|nr:DEAD/DEAH box helicase [bacterium]